MELIDYLKKRPGYGDIIEQVGEFFEKKADIEFELARRRSQPPGRSWAL